MFANTEKVVAKSADSEADTLSFHILGPSFCGCVTLTGQGTSLGLISSPVNEDIRMCSVELQGLRSTHAAVGKDGSKGEQTSATAFLLSSVCMCVLRIEVSKI